MPATPASTPTPSSAAATASASSPAPQRPLPPGPFPVGAYAAGLRRRLREFAHVQVTGEVWSLRVTRARVYFELRDTAGALPCSMWREDFDALNGTVADGSVVIAAGGCDFYPGSATASPSFSFAVTQLRIAGEGDLLAQIAQLRRRLDAEGLFAHQAALPRPALPRCIGVVCARGGKAGDDIRAGLARRGWAGRLVWAYAPVQDRRAAPAIAARLRDLAATPQVDVVIVARGGGSLADLLAFCDESLCRTVALLRIPVIASVGHHTDRTLIDDVAAVCCSTPTHAAESAVPIDVAAARATLIADARRLRRHGRRAEEAHANLIRDTRRIQRHSRDAVRGRVRVLAALARAGETVAARQRTRLHQLLRELRAAARRATGARAAGLRGHAAGLDRAATRGAGADASARRRDLERLTSALTAHDPQRALARGYALVTDREDCPLPSAAHARRAGHVVLHFNDGPATATVQPDPEERP